MLRLPAFEVHEPTTVAEAVALLATHGERARILAGGTDLVPNMKHEVEEPGVVISLGRVDALRYVVDEGDRVRVGPLVTLDTLAHHPLVGELFPSLVDAVSQIAGPQLRVMGTIGGNVCLDTRCVYINQSYFWRQALGFCLKKDGTVCHVVKTGKRCVAAASNDSAPVLMTLGAQLVLTSQEGARTLPIDDFYVGNGAFNQDRTRAELLTDIVIPKPARGTVAAYTKLRTRAAIDFPELGVAVRASLDASRTIASLDVCLTALGARPVHVNKLDAFVGQTLDEATIAAIGAVAYERTKPLTNIATDPAYRREMVPVYVKRAFQLALTRPAPAVALVTS